MVVPESAFCNPATGSTRMPAPAARRPRIAAARRCPTTVRGGRDASDLFTTGRVPAGWRDIAFLRQAGLGPEGWLTVVTDRYKLVYSPRDMPWLFDLEKDPDERTNFLPKPEYRATVRDLSKALLEYGNRYQDPYIKAPRIQADLEWAIHGPNAYTQRN